DLDRGIEIRRERPLLVGVIPAGAIGEADPERVAAEERLAEGEQLDPLVRGPTDPVGHDRGGPRGVEPGRVDLGGSDAHGPHRTLAAMTPDNDPALDSAHDPAGRARLAALLEPLGVAYELFVCDPALADTAAFCAAYGFAPEESANTILVIGKGDPPLYAACVVLAPNRLDVNRTVRDRLGTRKASFAPAEATREITGMEIGGVTVFGL